MGQMGANWEFVGVITKSRVGPDDLTSRYSHNDSHFTPSFSSKSDYSHHYSHAADSPAYRFQRRVRDLLDLAGPFPPPSYKNNTDVLHPDGVTEVPQGPAGPARSCRSRSSVAVGRKSGPASPGDGGNMQGILQALADDRLSQSRGGIDLLLGDDGAIG
jgi:hypothetical protein